MKLNDLVKEFGLEVKTGAGHLDREVTGGYVSDLLSDVLAHAEDGNALGHAPHPSEHRGRGSRTRGCPASFWYRAGSRNRTRSPRPRKRTSRSW